MCSAVHRKRCSRFMRWGNKGVKGCKELSCPSLHPSVCPASLDLLCTDQSCAYKVHTYKCKRKKADRSDKSQQTVSGSVKEKRLGAGQQQGKRKGKPKSDNRGVVKPKPSDQPSDKVAQSGSGCACSAKSSKPAAAPSHVCCQQDAGQSDPASHQAASNQSCTGSCQAGLATGFQPPTVQPVLEAMMENVKKEMLQKQDFMLQMLRMEMLQARHPLGRGAYGLLPSF